ncbi:DUF305 domain-containing protein [Micromonospora sp. NPDC048830]|uniref:DUF305 domain-containing protein n=1 Tax=Micromonospora sp. NPDC048830 TaxID=3364257 RepID=UPI003719C7BC
MFAAMMVPHRQEGIKLAQMALNKSTTPGVKELAQRSLQNQQTELPELQSIAQSGNMSQQLPEEPLSRFNEQEMTELKQFSGREFDLKWLDIFSGHHMSAIMMADMNGAGLQTEARRRSWLRRSMTNSCRMFLT